MFHIVEKRIADAFAARLKRALRSDAGINALVMLHSRAMLASLSIGPELENIRAWFGESGEPDGNS